MDFKRISTPFINCSCVYKYLFQKYGNGFKEIFFTVLLISIFRIILEYIKAFNLSKFSERYVNDLRLRIGEKLNKTTLFS
ncbi:MULTISPECIES: hypothetical protein [Dictyoglomus]|uniref:hypothetical protein n=1 Tax=Dictyoglomus TaxID=13 RepID=UPI0013E89F89|nr:hypothetical protein [Dictyoglomus turgidum]